MLPALQALSEPRREQIVRLVWRGERTAGDIAGRMPVTFGAVSQHLKVLLAAGLVTLRKDGRRRWYAANKDAFGELAPALEAMWFGKLGELKRLAEAEQRRVDGARAVNLKSHRHGGGARRPRSGRKGRGT